MKSCASIMNTMTLDSLCRGTAKITRTMKMFRRRHVYYELLAYATLSMSSMMATPRFEWELHI